MGINIRDGNIDNFGMVTVNIDPASVAANTTVAQTFTVPGLRVGDFVALSKPTTVAGLTFTNTRVSATETLMVTFINATGAAINAAAEDWTLLWFRNDAGGSALPRSLP